MSGSDCRLLFGCLIILLVSTGCTTVPGTGDGAFLGRPSAPRAPSPQQLAAARREARLSELEQAVSRLRSEVDGIGSSLNGLSSRTDAFSRQFDARSADAVALRSELAALRGELNAVTKKLDAIPETFGRLLDEQGRTIRSEVDREIQARIRAASPSRGGHRSSTQSGTYYEHEVGAGQTLSEIAQVYGVTVDAIISENNIKNPSLIRAGQKLLIPAN